MRQGQRVWSVRLLPPQSEALTSPFPHQALLQRCIVSPGGALPGKAPLRVDPGEQGEPRQGRVLPVHQVLLEGAAGL